MLARHLRHLAIRFATSRVKLANPWNTAPALAINAAASVIVIIVSMLVTFMEALGRKVGVNDMREVRSRETGHFLRQASMTFAIPPSTSAMPVRWSQAAR